MDQNERQVIDGLFSKLRQVGQQAPQRDAEAEAHIRQQVAAMPAAPYYMAQALLVQEQALTSLQTRVQQLEREAAQRSAGGGGFLGGLFGGAQSTAPTAHPLVMSGPIPQQYLQQGAVGAAAGPWGRPAMGGGFLAGAMQTAVGVAGGMLIADALTSAFSGGAAEAGELAHEAGWGETAPTDVEPPEPQNAGYDDPGFDDPGFDGGGDD
ncbi:MAG: DUF2076 domain-containing protein, partial [Geminicoccaceae bacterium]